MNLEELEKQSKEIALTVGLNEFWTDYSNNIVELIERLRDAEKALSANKLGHVRIVCTCATCCYYNKWDKE